MKRVIESIGKNVTEAIEEGIKKLGVSADDVDIKIINQGGFFKKAKVEIIYDDGLSEARIEAQKELILKESATKQPVEAVKPQEKPAAKPKDSTQQEVKKEAKQQPKPVATAKKQDEKATQKPPSSQPTQNQNTNKSSEGNQKHKAKDNNFKSQKPPKSSERHSRSAPVTDEHTKVCTDFLSGVITRMGIDAKLEVKAENGLNIEIITEDSAVIGYRGEVLDALQFLTSLVLNEAGGRNVHLNLDALGYRDKRVATLKSLAHKMADKCTRFNKRIVLEPMRSSERRIIHAELQDNEKIFTRSEGSEPNRHVVILPSGKGKKSFANAEKEDKAASTEE